MFTIRDQLRGHYVICQNHKFNVGILPANVNLIITAVRHTSALWRHRNGCFFFSFSLPQLYAHSSRYSLTFAFICVYPFSLTDTSFSSPFFISLKSARSAIEKRFNDNGHLLRDHDRTKFKFNWSEILCSGFQLNVAAQLLIAFKSLPSRELQARK